MIKKVAIGVALLACIIVAGALWYRHAAPANQAEGDAASPEKVNALVKTKPVAQQKIPDNLAVFGDVVPGKIVAASFPQAGRISQLLVVPGQQVHEGQLLATLTTDPQTQAAYSQAVNAVSFAQADLHHNEDLFALQLATKSQLDLARKALRDAESNLESQKRLGGDAGSGALSAQFDGVITSIPVSQGDRIQAGATILQVGRTGILRAQLGVEPGESRRVRVGMLVTLSPVQATDQKIAAKISEVQNMIDPKTLLVTVLVDLPAGGSPQLVAGMHIQGVIHAGEHLAWSIPRQAVLNDEKGDFLFQVNQGKAVRIEVKKVQESGDILGIEGNLDAKLPVVVLGNYELEDGMPVREEAR